MLMEVNEYLLAHKDDDNNTPPSSEKSGDNDALKEDTNKGTLTLDAACAPANIHCPQDISLLNEAGRNWKPSFTVFANPMACHCQDVIEDVPEKTIWHLRKVKNIVQRKLGRHSINSLATLQGTSDISKSS